VDKKFNTFWSTFFSESTNAYCIKIGTTNTFIKEKFCMLAYRKLLGQEAEDYKLL